MEQVRARPWRAALSQVLIVLTMWLSLAPALHVAGDDADCNPAIVLHDSAQHRITSSGAGVETAPAADHCLACHLFRSSRTAGSWKFVPQALVDGSLVLDAARDLLVTRKAVPLPARAPPVLI